MRVGLIIYDSLDQVSGGYLYDRKLVEYLQSQGDEICLFSLPRRNTLRHLGDNFSPHFARQIITSSVDVLLQDELNHASLFLLNRKSAIKSAFPTLAIVHHLRCMEARQPWSQAMYRWIEKRYLNSVEGFIFNSSTTQQSVYQVAAKARTQPWVVARPAWNHLRARIDEASIRTRALRAGALQLVFVGNLIPRKGLHTLLEALQLVQQEAWELSIIGGADADRRYAQRMAQKIQSMSQGKRIHLLGRLDQAALEKRLAQAHVLVVPSDYEGYGIVYLEAMAFGLPPIATTRGAAGEIITHEQDGFLLPVGDYKTLAQTISYLARERQHLARMGLAALHTAHRHPTWEESCQKIRDLLVRVTNGAAKVCVSGA